MISFNSECDFQLKNEEEIRTWIASVITSENKKEGDINYIFCNDDYLHKLNVEFLNHDTLTDIISFDYSMGNELHGAIYISVERVEENANDFEVEFEDELKRVMVHGILHYCGYKDKTAKEKTEMKEKEDYYLLLS